MCWLSSHSPLPHLITYTFSSQCPRLPSKVHDLWRWLPPPSELLWEKEVSFLLNVTEQAGVLDCRWHLSYEKEWNLTYDEINTVTGRIKEGNQIFTDITDPLDQLILKPDLELDFLVMWAYCLKAVWMWFYVICLIRDPNGKRNENW